MCGIAGIVAWQQEGEQLKQRMNSALQALYHRGPDAEGVFEKDNVWLGHRRLSIIDTTEAANQPLSDATGRYTIIFNGEFFSFQKYRNQLQNIGVSFKTQSDTEVILYGYIHWGADFFQFVDGFFALAIYDSLKNELIIARDRFGIKPLYYSHTDNYFLFASELSVFLKAGATLSTNINAVHTYLQLSYIPAPLTIYNEVKKFPTGTTLILDCSVSQKLKPPQFKSYLINTPTTVPKFKGSYEQAIEKLRSLLEQSVSYSLISDVPIGAFLSGGIDSSILVAVASQHTQQLNTFSIGYKDNPFFDETRYALAVAERYKTNHHSFSLSRDELVSTIELLLSKTDEPFGDSSSIPLYILAQKTRKHVTVAISGDGADEIFGGYNKYAAELKIRTAKLFNTAVKLLNPIYKHLPSSRNNPFGNKIRQLKRYNEGLKLNGSERYWRWCSYMSETEAAELLANPLNAHNSFKNDFLKDWKNTSDFNYILAKDVELVLQNDMLVKVDRMSMLNSLEVRPPFLNPDVVEFAFSLPDYFKIDRYRRKKILLDTFRDKLPECVYKRPKHGFEVPMLDIFKNELRKKIEDDWLSKDSISSVPFLNYQAISSIKEQLFSANPAESAGITWNLIVLVNWYRNNMP